MLEDILAGIGGGLQGGVEGYSWLQEQGLEKEKVRQRAEIESMKLEIRQLIEQLREEGRDRRHETPSGNVVTQEKGREGRHDRPSGNVLTTQEGLDRRHASPSGTATMLETGRRERWFKPSGNAALQADTARYGVDTRDTTTRRGQDFSYELGMNRNALVGRGQDIHRDLGRDRNQIMRDRIMRQYAPYDNPFEPTGVPAETPAPAAPAPSAAPPAVRSPRPVTLPPETLRSTGPARRVKGGTQDVYQWPDRTLRAYPPQHVVTPPAAKPPTRPPVVGRPPGVQPDPLRPIPPEAAEAAMAARTKSQRLSELATQVQQTLAKYHAEQDPAKRRVLGFALQRLKQQIVEAQGK